MCQVFGYQVVKLKRIRIMNIHLNNLKIGQWRDLTSKELKELMKDIDY
jgi:23S rRNA pseudouridine2604 synthase